MSEKIRTDICVIGGGSGGLSVAAGAVQMGARVVLVEGGLMGGDCLNHGCVPSKSLIAAAKHAHVMTTGAPFGIKPVKPEVDFAATKDHVRRVIDEIAPNDSIERFQAMGVTVINQFGTFISRRKLKAGDTIIKARRFVIATGSSPFVPPIPGLDHVPFETNETIFELREAPSHLIVIGGGPIGLELAQAHRRLGCKVTVIEAMTALPKDDSEMAAVVLENLRAEGVTIVEGAMASEIKGAAGAIEVHTKDGAVFKGSHLLVAVGRKPNLDRLDLERAGVTVTRAAIAVDARLKSTNRRIYAIGDVAGGMQFTHAAGYQAGVVIRSALFGLPSKSATAHIPWATFTDPEISHVGMSEAAAKERFGDALEVVRFPYSENDRARAELKTNGLIKVMVVRGRPVGASIAGAQAGELIQVWSLAIANRLKMNAIAAMVSPYPTLGEINKRVAGAYFSPRLFESDRVKKLVRFVQWF